MLQRETMEENPPKKHKSNSYDIHHIIKHVKANIHDAKQNLMASLENFKDVEGRPSFILFSVSFCAFLLPNLYLYIFRGRYNHMDQ